MIRRGILVALVLLAALPAAAQRLPATVTPEHYTLSFTPELKEETFGGRAAIRVQVNQPTREITLHAAEITFNEVTITANGQTQKATVTLNPATETATLAVPNTIPAGTAEITITYKGILNDKLRGFYISKANGRSYAVTQMEATDARRAFPSFDEPMYKATYDVSMTVDTGDTAISNGRQISDTPGPQPGKHTIRFATTPKMSTYLVAMIVGDFVCRDGESDGTTLRVCSTPDKLPLTAFAMDVAKQQLKFFNDYFGVKYPFGKLDIIAAPDFAAGAMENAGAILFRERLLLIDPARSSVDVQKQVASIISHEIAHQWFGNLVTMKWWDDIWLNEGFATWIASKPIEAWKPEWRMFLSDAEDTQGALGLDALRSTRAIRTKVETPEEINEVFDGIAYEKTAAVLRMIESFVGADAFQKAIQSYIRKYSWGNAAGEDFWTEVTTVTGRPIDRILRSFVDQPGVPVLSIKTACVDTQLNVTATQARFFGSPAPAGTSAPAPQTWTFPACGKIPGFPGSQCAVVEEPLHTVQVPICQAPFANADARGYFLTEYTPAHVRELATAPLAPVEKLSLLGDEWWMVRAGRHDIDAFLDLASAQATDDTPAVLDNVVNRLGYVAANIASAAELPRLQAWIRSKFAPVLAAIGLPGTPADPDDVQNRRATLLAVVGGTGNDADTQKRARELAAGYIANPSSLSPTIATTVLQVAAAGGDRALYDQYVAQLSKTGNQPEEYYRFFNSLAAFRDPALVTRTLQFALSDAVRSQDTGTLIAGLISRPGSRESAWEFTRREWRSLTQKLGTFQGIPTIVSALGSYCSMDKAAEIRQFFAQNPVRSSERALQQSLERIEACAALDARQSAPFSAWLATAK
jgi:aminopeptidase N